MVYALYLEAHEGESLSFSENTTIIQVRKTADGKFIFFKI